MPIIRGDDSRRLVPEAMVRVLTHLIDELEVDSPSSARVELRTIRSRLCRLYRIADPQAVASDVDVAHDVEEEDGVPQDF